MYGIAPLLDEIIKRMGVVDPGNIKTPYTPPQSLEYSISPTVLTQSHFKDVALKDDIIKIIWNV